MNTHPATHAGSDLPRGSFGHTFTLWVSLAAVYVATVAIMAAPLLAAQRGVTLAVGQSANEDILAPRAATYVSEVLTERNRASAAAAVADVYDAPDARVARQQVLLLHDVLDYIDAVRADDFATPAQSRNDLLAIAGLALAAPDANLILNLGDNAWSDVRDEALAVLEQTMRARVRADQVEAVRRDVPTRISVSLSEAQARVVAALVTPLVAANSFYNEAATQAAREAARTNVEPVVPEIVPGQAVVKRGQVVTAADLEALRALDLLETKASWREPASAVLISTLAIAGLLLYTIRFNPELSQAPRKVVLLGLLFTSFLLAARLMVPDRTVLPFLFPAPALAMLLTVFISPHLAVIVSLALAGLVGYMGGHSLQIAVYIATGSITATLIVGRGERVNQFFWAGVVAALANAGVLLAFQLPDTGLDPLGLAQLLIASVVNGAISASLTLAGFFLLGGIFDITTSLQLIELSRPDHPLLRFILRNAPGTYQHSLQVANLAEQAAERIGANAMLTRVGALYHDCGKALHPQYFVENQLDGHNIHDALDPHDSARIIIGHIRDGLEMARRHRLPSAVRAFIPEHHGTLRTIYQYKRAVQAAGGDAARVDPTHFVYPGPRPQSKETALLMLADGCEAIVRSERPQTEADIDRIVLALIQDRAAHGQLDDTNLTLQDLGHIRESFVTTLKGVFHPRLEYPADEHPPALPAPESRPAIIVPARPPEPGPEDEPPEDEPA